jgi:iron complex outermembrane receptor protein
MKSKLLLSVVCRRRILLCTSLLGTQLIPFNIAHAEDSASVFEEVIVVTGTRTTAPASQIKPDSEAFVAPDAAALVQRLPGAALINNGSLSGQVQYRGMFGSRVSTKINSQSFHSGGPNLMDPPMSYAPPTLIESITVNRGTSSVAFGPSMSGGVNANLKSLDYSGFDEYRTQYDVTAIGRTADESYTVGGIVGVANEQFKISGLFSVEDGSDQRFADGDITNTFHARRVFGLTGGYKTDLSELTLAVRRHETDPAGNAPFTMDIKLIDTDFLLPAN